MHEKNVKIIKKWAPSIVWDQKIMISGRRGFF